MSILSEIALIVIAIFVVLSYIKLAQITEWMQEEDDQVVINTNAFNKNDSDTK